MAIGGGVAIEDGLYKQMRSDRGQWGEEKRQDAMEPIVCVVAISIGQACASSSDADLDYHAVYIRHPARNPEPVPLPLHYQVV